MPYKIMTFLFAAIAAFSPATGFSEILTEERDLQSQIAALDSQIEELSKSRDEETFQAELIRRQIALAQKNSQASKNALHQMEMHLETANDLDKKIAALQQQRATLQARLDAAKSP